MPKANSENRCQQINAHGRQCRSLRGADHPALCSYHAREERHKSKNPDTLAVDLLGSIHDFRTATSVNHVLGKLLLLLATDRIPPRNAAVLAYICQLLLQSLSDVKHELYIGKQEPDMKKALKQILASPSPATEASKFADDLFKLTLGALERTEGQLTTAKFVVPGGVEGPALVKSNASATT
jgi:hypothetical protein